MEARNKKKGQETGYVRIFYFHIFNIAKIWLNTLMDDPHLSNITKLLLKKKHTDSTTTYSSKKQIQEFYYLT
jgi:hypothetical protein